MRPPLELGEHGEITVKEIAKGKYEARVYFRDNTGVRKEKRARAKSKEAARKLLLKRMKQEHGAGGELTSHALFTDLSSYWVQGIDVSPTTQQTYLRILNHITPYLQGYHLYEITTQTIERIIRAESTPRIENGQKRGGPAAGAQALKVLKLVFEEGMRIGAMTHNPALLVRRARTEPREVKVLTLDEVRDVRENVQDYYRGKTTGTAKYMPDLIDFLIGTGVRIGEALALRWEDLELNTGFVTIQGTLLKSGVYQPHTKTGEVRSMRLPTWLIKVLKARKLRSDNDFPFVFYTDRMTTINSANFYKSLKIALPEKYHWITAHTFRRTVATLIDRELGAEAAALQLGHEGTAVTKKSYIARKGVSDAASLLDEVI